jgi:predicted O-methyltransferase YrrM
MSTTTLPPYRTGDNLTGLQDLARDHIRPGMAVLEIGAFVGASTNVFLDAGARVLSIDPWDEQMPGYQVDGDIYEAWHRNTGGRAGGWRMTGAEFFKLCPDQVFDFAYIDAIHTYKAVRDDIDGCLQMLKPGGILAGHDYDRTHFPGVARAVDERARALGLRVKTYRDTSWILQL